MHASSPPEGERPNCHWVTCALFGPSLPRLSSLLRFASAVCKCILVDVSEAGQCLPGQHCSDLQHGNKKQKDNSRAL